MSDPGLSHRLRQRSRRAGLMIGLTMVLTIAVCAVGFTVIFTALDPFTADFVSQTDDPATEDVEVAAANTDDPVVTPTAPADSGDEGTSDASGDNSTDSSASSGNALPGGDSSSEDNSDDDFDPDYQVNPDGPRINLREGPGTNTSIISAFDPGTPLQYTGEDDSSGGIRWMQFLTGDGAEGWMRDVDVVENSP